jgi:hypothetical protein
MDMDWHRWLDVDPSTDIDTFSVLGGATEASPEVEWLGACGIDLVETPRGNRLVWVLRFHFETGVHVLSGHAKPGAEERWLEIAVSGRGTTLRLHPTPVGPLALHATARALWVAYRREPQNALGRLVEAYVRPVPEVRLEAPPSVAELVGAPVQPWIERVLDAARAEDDPLATVEALGLAARLARPERSVDDQVARLQRGEGTTAAGIGRWLSRHDDAALRSRIQTAVETACERMEDALDRIDEALDWSDAGDNDVGHCESALRTAVTTLRADRERAESLVVAAHLLCCGDDAALALRRALDRIDDRARLHATLLSDWPATTDPEREPWHSLATDDPSAWWVWSGGPPAAQSESRRSSASASVVDLLTYRLARRPASDRQALRQLDLPMAAAAAACPTVAEFDLESVPDVDVSDGASGAPSGHAWLEVDPTDERERLLLTVEVPADGSEATHAVVLGERVDLERIDSAHFAGRLRRDRLDPSAAFDLVVVDAEGDLHVGRLRKRR